jgi:hypothetical protein
MNSIPASSQKVTTLPTVMIGQPGSRSLSEISLHRYISTVEQIDSPLKNEYCSQLILRRNPSYRYRSQQGPRLYRDGGFLTPTHVKLWKLDQIYPEPILGRTFLAHLVHLTGS